MGARLKYFTDFWPLLTKDPWILGSIHKGIKLDFLTMLRQQRARIPPQFWLEMVKRCEIEIEDLLVKEAIIEIGAKDVFPQ